MKTFKFSLVLRTRENTDIFITLDDNIYGIHSQRVNILYVFLFCISNSKQWDVMKLSFVGRWRSKISKMYTKTPLLRTINAAVIDWWLLLRGDCSWQFHCITASLSKLQSNSMTRTSLGAFTLVLNMGYRATEG